MTTREEALACCLALENTASDQPFRDPGWTAVRRRENRKIFALIFERNGQIWINVKVDPEWRDFWRSAFPAVVPAYHMNKEHWNSIILDGSVPEKDIRRMIGESYDLVGKTSGRGNEDKMSEFARNVYHAVASIPKGKVATYGQIARLAGNPRAFRAVGSLLHKNKEPGVYPCHRVVNSQGQMAPDFAFGGADEQARKLEAEGVEVKNGRVDLKKWQM